MFVLDLFFTVDYFSDESESDEYESGDRPSQKAIPMSPPSSPCLAHCCCDKYGKFLPFSDDDSGFGDVEDDDMFHKWTSPQAQQLSSSRPDFAAELNNLFGSSPPQDTFEHDHMNMVC